jgi:alpha-galactosidase
MPWWSNRGAVLRHHDSLTGRRDTPSGPADYGIDYDLFYNTTPITAGKTVATVTLPANSAIHIFAVAIKP